jgi:hypothetical protein
MNLNVFFSSLKEIQSGAPLDETERQSDQPTVQNDQETATDQPANVSAEVLSDIIHNVMEANAKFQPYLQEYYNMLINDSTEPVLETSENRRQRFCNNVNDMMHLIGHLFHNLSDLHINLRDRPPRNIRTMVQFQTAIISTAPIASMPTSTTTSTHTTNPINATQNEDVPPINSSLLGPAFNFSSVVGPSTSDTSRIAGAFAIPISTSSSGRPILIQGSRYTMNFDGSQFTHSDSNSSPENSNEATSNVHSESSSEPMSSNNTNNEQPRTNNPLQQIAQIGDPYLTCSSVHFLNSSVNNVVRNSNTSSPSFQRINITNNNTQRRRHPAGNQNSSQTDETGEQAHHLNDLSRLVGDIITPFVRNNMPENIRVNFDPITNSLRMQSGTNAQPETTTSTSANNSTTTTTRNVGTEVFREIFSVINSNNLQDQRLQRPVSELVESISGSSIATEDTASTKSALWNIFNILFNSMNLGDMLNLAMNQSLDNVFIRSKTQLKNYIQNTLLNGNDLDENNERELIDRLYNDALKDLNINFDEFELKDGNNIDFIKSIEKLVKDHFKIFLNHILLNDDQNQWGTKFYQNFKDFRDQLIVLCRLCVKDANKKMTDLFCKRIEEIMVLSITNQAVRVTLQSHLQHMLNETFNSVVLEREVIEKYIVVKVKPVSSVVETPVASKLYQNDNTVMNNLTDARVIESSAHDFKNVLPFEWLQTVSSDIRTQVDSLHRYSFSDAYTTGMPSKRRKIVKKQETSSKNLLKIVMKRTLSQINTRANLTNETIVDSLGDEKQLMDTFNTQFDQVLSERLEKDKDYENLFKSTNDEQTSNGCVLNRKVRSMEEKFNFTRKRMK